MARRSGRRRAAADPMLALGQLDRRLGADVGDRIHRAGRPAEHHGPALPVGHPPRPRRHPRRRARDQVGRRQTPATPSPPGPERTRRGTPGPAGTCAPRPRRRSREWARSAADRSGSRRSAGRRPVPRAARCHSSSRVRSDCTWDSPYQWGVAAAWGEQRPKTRLSSPSRPQAPSRRFAEAPAEPVPQRTPHGAAGAWPVASSGMTHQNSGGPTAGRGGARRTTLGVLLQFEQQDRGVPVSPHLRHGTIGNGGVEELAPVRDVVDVGLPRRYCEHMALVPLPVEIPRDARRVSGIGPRTPGGPGGFRPGEAPCDATTPIRTVLMTVPPQVAAKDLRAVRPHGRESARPPSLPCSHTDPHWGA